MIKLQGHTLTPVDLFSPESMALTITERSSTAQITQGLDAPSLQAGDWLLDPTDPGAGIVWRVKTADSVFSGRTVTYTLEHIIQTLRDIAMFGEVKPDTITGIEGAETCTARQAAEYVLSRQDVWVLGDFEYTDSAAYSFNGDDLFSAMEKITSTLDDPWWDYDLSALPFKLHIRRKSSAAACEMRMGRNIATLRKTVDRSQMYTRIYPIGKKNLHLSGEYLSRNEGVWGRKDRVETDQSKETEEMLRLWALDRLKRHCEPAVTITIGGLDLSRATGETLDRLVIGTLCRVPLPEFGVTITERITKLSWKDKIKEPENVTVTLCNTRQDIASIISEQIAGGGGGARADAKEAEEDHAWFVDTTSHVAMVAEAIIGRDGETVDWSRVAEIIVDGSGIHQQVVSAQGSLVTAFFRLDANDESLTSLFQKTGVDGLDQGDTLYSRLTQTAESLSSEIVRATSAEGSLASRLTQTADSITAEVNRATAAEGSLSTRISQTAESITSEVARATAAEGSLASRISQTAESITAEVTRATTAESSLSSRIAQTAESITTEVTRATAAEGSLSSRIAQTAESVTSEVARATAAEGSLSSRISQTAESITSEVTRATTAEGSLASRISQTAESITAEVTRATTAEGSLASRISQTAESITSEVTRAKGVENTLGSRISQEADKIALVVSNGAIKAAEIVAAINNTGSAVRISATHIILDGQAVANSLSADDVIVQELNVGSVFASGTISANDIIADTGHGQISMASLADDLEDVETSMEDAVDGFGTPTASGGQISIPYTKVGGGTGTINFNIADTQFYQDGVSAAAAGVTLSGAWTGTTAAGKAYTVTASNGATRTSPRLNYIGKSGTPTWAENRKSFSQTLVVLDGDDDFLYQQAVSFDTTASYNAGKNDVDFTDQTSGWDAGYYDVHLSNGKSASVAMPSTASWSGERNVLGGFTVTCTVGGKEYYHVFNV